MSIDSPQKGIKKDRPKTVFFQVLSPSANLDLSIRQLFDALGYPCNTLLLLRVGHGREVGKRITHVKCGILTVSEGVVRHYVDLGKIGKGGGELCDAVKMPVGQIYLRNNGATEYGLTAALVDQVQIVQYRFKRDARQLLMALFVAFLEVEKEEIYVGQSLFYC